MKKFVFPLFVFLVVVGVWLGYLYRISIQDFLFEAEKAASLPKAIQAQEIKEASSTPVIMPAEDIEVLAFSQAAAVRKTSLLAEINLDVPFSTQAPHANWSLPYQEACEEASILLVNAFYNNEKLTPEIADREISKIVEWEKQKFGYYEHTTSEETALILREYFGYSRVEIRYDITLDDIKQELSQGRPVIVPFAGRLLGNPNYRRPGPVYHMLVIKGFTKDGRFITNDVGTRRGHNYTYDPEVLFSAIHDAPEGGSVWIDSDPAEYIKKGRKAMIVVYPQSPSVL